MKLKHINVDVCSQSGESIISNELTGLSPNLWIASGSVLCGQVGDFPMAETVLKKMASTLDHDNGYIIVTGFTQSFLNPVMIDNAGLEVLHGSLPSVEAGGLESGFKGSICLCWRKKASKLENPAFFVTACCPESQLFACKERPQPFSRTWYPRAGFFFRLPYPCVIPFTPVLLAPRYLPCFRMHFHPYIINNLIYHLITVGSIF